MTPVMGEDSVSMLSHCGSWAFNLALPCELASGYMYVTSSGCLGERICFKEDLNICYLL